MNLIIIITLIIIFYQFYKATKQEETHYTKHLLGFEVGDLSTSEIIKLQKEADKEIQADLEKLGDIPRNYPIIPY